ncbi:hypothetical protein D3C78_842160 [compost metagenome]
MVHHDPQRSLAMCQEGFDGRLRCDLKTQAGGHALEKFGRGLQFASQIQPAERDLIRQIPRTLPQQHALAAAGRRTEQAQARRSLQ